MPRAQKKAFKYRCLELFCNTLHRHDKWLEHCKKKHSYKFKNNVEIRYKVIEAKEGDGPWKAIEATNTTTTADESFGFDYMMINRQLSSWTAKGWTIHQPFDQVASANPQKIAVRLEEEAWTFKELQEFSLRIANYFHNNGYVKGDTVALLMENHPRYIGVWLGLSRIGVITALLNTGAKGNTLNQAVTTATKQPCKAIIVSVQYLKELEALQSSTDKVENMKLYTMGGAKPRTSLQELQYLDDQLQDLKPVAEELVRSLDMTSKMVYVYTSGTTGAPKAATFNFKRFAFMSVGIHTMQGIRKSDVLYTPMPLYHTSGGLVGTGQMLFYGNTMVIKTKFSKTNYFPDCKKYGVTVGQYIGEMCSYLYSLPPTPADKDHHVRMMFGNGMRRSLWKDFQKRFHIKKIGEFYGSTEGNTNMANVNNKVGAVGFMPWFAAFVYPVDLIEYDTETGDPVRGPDGLCRQARTKGLLVGGIKNSGTGMSNFEGYADEKATQKKIIRNVFKKGDAYFNSGDVLERDIFNYYYFVDRLGDTFRWKGENVATSQVETIIVKNMGLSPDKVAVYGVEVKNVEGKAGMAAFAMEDEQVDKTRLVKVAKEHLAPQQIPVFLRITKDLPLTSTEKIQKAVLQKQGWNPEKIIGVNGERTDKLYYYNSATKPPRYDVLTQEVHDSIIAKKILI